MALVSCAALVGCTSYAPVAIKPQDTIRAFEARTFDGAEVQDYIASHRPAQSMHRVTIWDLESLVLAAYYYSPELDLARAQAATAAASVETAAQLPNPTLQLPFTYTTDATSGSSPFALGLGLDIPIETAGKRGYRVALATRLSAIAQLKVGVVAWQVRSRLRTHLLAWYSARQQSLLIDQKVLLRERILELLDKRLSLGAAAAPEVQQVRLALMQDRLALAAAHHQMQDVLALAAQTIGVPESELSKLQQNLNAFESINISLPSKSIRDQALQNRSDIRVALADYEASQEALQLEVANQYPDIHLGPGFAYDTGAHKISLTLSGIPLPLFNRNEGPIAQARARRWEASAHFNAVQDRAIGQIDLAVQRWRAATQDLQQSGDLLALQERRAIAIHREFDIGASDRLSLTLAELDQVTDKMALAQAQVQLQRAWGDLEDAVERPLEPVPHSTN
jgi:cobalt-zinc-cadmium efflux system outer membrane protein